MTSEAELLFLSMYWGGGGPFTLAELLHVFDWINRMVPSRDELEVALNELLAAGLVEARGESYRIPVDRYRDVADYRRRQRKDRFEAVSAYFRRLARVDTGKPVIRLAEESYGASLKEYKESFARAFGDSGGPGGSARRSRRRRA